MRKNQIPAWLTPLVFLGFLADSAGADALDRLKLERLEAVHQARAAFTAELRPPPRPGPYREYRANLHVHSLLSHDSRGTVAEIVKAAKAAGTSVLFFTEHPAAHYDYVTEGHSGLRDGVLLIPGAETEGFLAFPTRSLRGLTSKAPQEFADLVRRGGGRLFLSHLEERMDWDVRGLAGVEIYNTHADFKDERRLASALRNPLWLVRSADLFRRYPQEAFSALLDYPADYLRRWDELCRRAPHTGVAANDAHQNVGLVVRFAAGNKLHVEDALGKSLFQLDAAALPALGGSVDGKRPGDVVFQLRLDPYECSLRHVGTHLLAAELTPAAVWDALESGRAFVAFDWLADATGFEFVAIKGEARFDMGTRPAWSEGLQLRARAPLPVRWRVLRDGRPVLETAGCSLEIPAAGPGAYRVEAWLRVDGADQIWILSNPIYVRPTR